MLKASVHLSRVEYKWLVAAAFVEITADEACKLHGKAVRRVTQRGKWRKH